MTVNAKPRARRGCLLSGQELLAKFRAGQVFKEGTWNEENIRATGYDLRMAEDLLVVPDPKFPSGRVYPRNTRRYDEVILQPGDGAFVSSHEKVCIPWDVSATVGTKFSLASKGILMLTGTIVDPGYGLEQKDGNWRPKADERLHFLLANVGPGPVVLRPGKERIAALQFYLISPPDERLHVRSLGYNEIESRFLNERDPNGAGLVFFRTMADIKIAVSGQDRKFAEFNEQLAHFNQRVSSVELGSNQVVMFGIYLLCATIIGVSIATLLSALQGGLVDKLERLHEVFEKYDREAWFLLIALVSATFLSTSLMRYLVLFLRKMLRRTRM